MVRRKATRQLPKSKPKKPYISVLHDDGEERKENLNKRLDDYDMQGVIVNIYLFVEYKKFCIKKILVTLNTNDKCFMKISYKDLYKYHISLFFEIFFSFNV
ncbi:UNVERIFIED_CONTAM: hypothetical protein RMT77_018957 [Armadillidium vulgare]